MRLAREVGFPLVVRPSYVLGGRAMEVVFTEDDLRAYMTDAVRVSNDSPVCSTAFWTWPSRSMWTRCATASRC